MDLTVTIESALRAVELESPWVLDGLPSTVDLSSLKRTNAMHLVRAVALAVEALGIGEASFVVRSCVDAVELADRLWLQWRNDGSGHVHRHFSPVVSGSPS